MESFYVKRIREVGRNKKMLEKKLGVTIKTFQGKVMIEGSAEDIYDAEQVFQALDFGFSLQRALLLKEEDFVFQKVHIHEHTKRNLVDVKARLIGTKGKTKRVLSQLSDCEIMIKEGEVGVIGYVEDVEDTVVAIINIIKGSKQSNMYKFLEKRGKQKKDDFVPDMIKK
jgi:ribosomal RNA assembly protein